MNPFSSAMNVENNSLEVKSKNTTNYLRILLLSKTPILNTYLINLLL